MGEHKENPTDMQWVLDEASDGIYVCNANTYEILYMNKVIRNISLNSNQSYKGRKCYEYIGNLKKPCPFCKMELMNDKTFTERVFEDPVHKKHYNLRGKIIDWRGIPAHIEYIRDITKSVNNEKELNRTTARLKNMLDAAPGAVSIFDANLFPNGQIYISNGWHNLVGIEHLANNELKIEDFLFEESKKKAYLAMKEAIANRDMVEIPLKIHRVDGSEGWIHYSAKPVEYDNGLYFYGFFNDISRAKQIERQILESLERNQALMNAIPGGLVIFELVNEKLEISFSTDGFTRLIGYSFEDFKKYELTLQDIIYSDDLEKFKERLNNALLLKRSLDIQFRVITKSSGISWVRLNTSNITGGGRNPSFYGVFSDVNEIYNTHDLLRIEKERSDCQYQNILETYNNLPCGIIWFSACENPKIRFTNRQAAIDLGLGGEDSMKSIYDLSLFEHIFYEDRKKTINSIAILKKVGDKVDLSLRLVGSNNKIIHIVGIANLTKHLSGRVLAQFIYNDVSIEKKKDDDLLKEALRYESLVKSIPGGVAIYKMDGRLTPVYVSNKVCKLHGLSTSEYINSFITNQLSFMSKEDNDMLMNKIGTLSIGYNKSITHVYRITSDNIGERWIQLCASKMISTTGDRQICAVMMDYTERHQAESALNDIRIRYELATRSSRINAWEYNIALDKLLVYPNIQGDDKEEKEHKQYSTIYTNEKLIREDCRDKFFSIFSRLRNGEKEITEDIWIKGDDDTDWWCERISYINVFDKNGNPVKAFGSGKNITNEKEAEKRFKDELAYRKVMQKATVVSLKIDLSKNIVSDAESKFGKIAKMINGLSADEYFEYVAKLITNSESQEEFRKRFNRRALIQSYRNGYYTQTIEIPRYLEDDKEYITLYTINLINKPGEDSIIAYGYSSDITKEKTMTSIMKTIARQDYEFLILVDGATDHAVDYSVQNEHTLFLEGETYSKGIKRLIDKVVCNKDNKRIKKAARLENIKRELSKKETYRVYLTLYIKNEFRRKQIQFMRLEGQEDKYLMTMIDINNVFLEQENAKEKLKKALSAAKKANMAKSDFLARMSHDIRTPMNAILGLSKTALDEVYDKETTLETLKKINSSGEYLLGLLNDILDYSKIESKQLVLNFEPDSTKKCIDEIKTIINPQLIKKNILFELQVADGFDKLIMLDKLRFKQIWFNLISNAIKFTKDNGNIKLICSICGETDDELSQKFVLIDNGIGMSEEFQEHLFESFTQENTTASSELTGSGLGLAIVKNLVTLMNGEISVTSQKDVGTSITVIINSKKADSAIKKDVEVEKNNYKNLANKRVLLAEDHALNALVAIKILGIVKITCDVAKNGDEAIKLFEKSEPNYYDAILMDIRMPVKGGLEATKEIRNLEREDAKAIPIIAMTANAFIDDIKASMDAGMNAHLAKPIMPEDLFNTLQKFIKE